MITIQNRLANLPNSVFDFNASQDGKFGWFLLTWHPESDPVLEEIQTQIKLDIRNSALGQTSQLEIESWLKSFFSEYHWKMHATFRKTELKEKGISLLLAVLFDHELYVVEFGRMLCGIIDADYIQPSGRNWTNFHVRSLDEMALLGMSESDIPVKPKRLFVAENQRFIALPSVFSEQLLKLSVDSNTIDTLIQSILTDSDGCYFLLEGTRKLTAKRRPRLRRVRITAVAIILLTVLAVLYMRFGNRWLESSGRKVKLLLTSKSRLTVEQVPQYLNIRSQSFKRQLKKIEQFANQPARMVKLTQSWQTDLNFLITAAPSFDPQNIYITSDENLMAFDKSSKKLVWKKTFDSNIRETEVIRGNLIVFLNNGQVLCLQNNNTVAWTMTTSEPVDGRQPIAPLEISNEEDPRLNGSILIIPSGKGMSILDINSGKQLSEISYDKRIQYLSRYDAFDNCFYAVVADGIHCISLEVLN